jgi:hypothetical protein
MGGGVAAAVVISSEHHGHVAPQTHLAVAGTGAQTAAGIGPAHATATTSQATRASVTGKPLTGSTRQRTPRGAAGRGNSHPPAGAPAAAQGRPRQTPRTLRLVRRAFAIAIFYDAMQRSDGNVPRATCIPAAGSTAKDGSTTTYNCTAFVHANSSDSGSRYRYTGTVDVQSGIVLWHFVGAE